MGCVFYKPPIRDYNNLPRFSATEIKSSKRLLMLSYPVEKAVCSLDEELDFHLTDQQAIAIFEALLDLYAFGDSKETVSAKLQQLGCEGLIAEVEEELSDEPSEDVAKVLALVRHVARRRENGGRHHLEILHRYVPMP